MRTFHVTLKEVNYYTYIVDAEDETEAEELANANYDEEPAELAAFCNVIYEGLVAISEVMKEAHR